MATVGTILAGKGSDVFTIEPSNTIVDAARAMNERGVGGLVVVEDGRIVGIFTERDVLRRVVAQRLDAATTTIGDVMTSRVAVCRIDTPIEECRSIMARNRIRHLPVVKGDALVGIVTIGDVLAHGVSEHATTIEFLNDYICGRPLRESVDPPS